MKWRALSILLLAGVLLTSGCVVNRTRYEVREVREPVRVNSPVKAHLLDGSVVVYRNGANVGSDSIRGPGERFDALNGPAGVVMAVPLDSVVGIANYVVATSVGESVLLSATATAGAVLGGAALAVAVFGSCPTFYTDSAGAPRLEAEGFSYSIAPLFESRDVDALRGIPVSGTYTIDVRNEALETHHINHLELLVIDHADAMRALPDGRGRITTVASLDAPTHAIDATGRNVLPLLLHSEGELFEAAPARLAAASASDLMDHIDLDFGIAPADSVALVLRLRNSLLTTVLFYDVMLGAAGARAFDWVAQDLEQVGNAADMGRWYVERMGLRVSVWQDGEWREAGRLPDVGPIAWKEVAISLPARAGTPLRVRVEMPVDSWRIDRIALGRGASSIEPTVLPVTRVRRADGSIDDGILRAISGADEAYVTTEPGRRFTIEFDVPPSMPGRTRSYLLASQGFYIEWVRPDWVRNNVDGTKFVPSDASLYAAIVKWREGRDALEQAFYATRLPVE